jgi:hypothetical protein
MGKAPGITNKQIRIIQLAKKELGMDDASYRDLLIGEFGVKSSTRLDLHQANRLIDILQKKGFLLKPVNPDWRSVGVKPPRRTTKHGGKTVALASPAEREKIQILAELIDWRVENGLELFLASRAKVKDGKVRTSQDAYLAIEALKKLFENGMKKQYGPDWWLMEFADERIMGYIKRHKPEEYRCAPSLVSH